MNHHLTWLLVMITFAGVCIPGCGPGLSNLEVVGTIANQSFNARVDHDVARDYLEGRPLPGDIEDLRLTHREAGTLPSKEELTYLTERYSPDVATLFFLETVSEHQESEPLQRDYASAVARLMRTTGPSTLSISNERLTVAFAPGWFYKTHGAETGADFEGPRALIETMGVPTELIETDENGSVQENAETIAAWLRRLQEQGREVVVVSGSKSGAEVAVALGELLQPEDTMHILAWVSIGGVHRGSPFADWALNPTVCWLTKLELARQGFDLEGALSLQTGRQGPWFDRLQFPEHLLRISYIPVPLSGDISERAKFGYGRLRHQGPNDGLTMLVDQLLPGGLTIPALGADHYLDRPDQPLRSRALFEVVMQRIGAADS